MYGLGGRVHGVFTIEARRLRLVLQRVGSLAVEIAGQLFLQDGSDPAQVVQLGPGQGRYRRGAAGVGALPQAPLRICFLLLQLLQLQADLLQICLFIPAELRCRLLLLPRQLPELAGKNLFLGIRWPNLLSAASFDIWL